MRELIAERGRVLKQIHDNERAHQGVIESLGFDPFESLPMYHLNEIGGTLWRIGSSSAANVVQLRRRLERINQKMLDEQGE